jgi:hypothetical protein
VSLVAACRASSRASAHLLIHLGRLRWRPIPFDQSWAQTPAADVFRVLPEPRGGRRIVLYFAYSEFHRRTVSINALSAQMSAFASARFA